MALAASRRGRAATLVILFVATFLPLQPAGPVRGAADFTVTTAADAPDANPGDGACDSDAATPGAQCTLRAAIMEANALTGSQTVDLPAGIYTLTLAVTDSDNDDGDDGDLDVSGDLTIQGGWAAPAALALALLSGTAALGLLALRRKAG